MSAYERGNRSCELRVARLRRCQHSAACFASCIHVGGINLHVNLVPVRFFDRMITALRLS
jgi:hypothetical protein